MAHKRSFDSQVQQDVESRGIKGPTVSKKSRYKLYNFRLPEADMEAFRQYLAEEGVTLSAGVRQAILRYMRREGLK